MAVLELEWPRDVRAVAASLAATGSWYWLDGAAGEADGTAGKSYLGAASAEHVAQSGSTAQFLTGLAPRTNTPDAPQAWVVALSYEFGVELLGETPAADSAPPGFALRADTVLVLDHATGTAHLRGRNQAELQGWMRRHGACLQRVWEGAPDSGAAASGQTKTAASGQAKPAPSGQAKYQPRSPAAARDYWRHNAAAYLHKIASCQRAIAAGEAYVLCLTDTAQLRPGPVDPLSTYVRLRAAGGAIRGAVIVGAERALISHSPERFISKRGTAIITHPIKGTRPRGADPQADMRLAQQLRADPKERAENLMIVDLMRNDFSRVSLPASVNTIDFLRVESHPKVHQLVSSISGELAPGCDGQAVISACFPGGSMTGAPKVRAVQLLARLEGGPRGLYAGCFGWWEQNDDLELAMTIRSIELREPVQAASAHAAQRRCFALALVGAGGGITSDSDPAAEAAEKNLKAQPLLSVLHDCAAAPT